MREFTYNVVEIEREYGVPIGTFSNDFIIIDNEIQNDISADWDYLKGKVNVVGILYLDLIKIFVAEEENDEEFKNAVRDEINRLGDFAYIYAFNNKMEMGNFKGDMDFDVPIREIKPFNAKGWNKDKFYNELRKRNQIPDIKIIDVFNGNAGLCIPNWKKYLETGNFDYMMDIVSHNINCLLKESVILKNKHFFKMNWKVDKNNFMVGEKNAISEK